MKYFLDTEFIESGPSFPLIPLSVGIVDEDGREFYVVNEDAPLELASDWVKDNVIPHLGGPKLGITHIGPAILRWMTDSKPEFWGYYADYDWVIFCQLFGTMMQLPKGWPMYCRDIKQLCDSVGNPKLPKQTSTEHNALADAKWNLEAYRFLATLSVQQAGAWLSEEQIREVFYESLNAFSAKMNWPLMTEKLNALLAAPSPAQPIGEQTEFESLLTDLTHTRSCPSLTPLHEEDCTCGLLWRVRLRTEMEQCNAWRKRAMEVEAAEHREAPASAEGEKS